MILSFDISNSKHCELRVVFVDFFLDFSCIFCGYFLVVCLLIMTATCVSQFKNFPKILGYFSSTNFSNTFHRCCYFSRLLKLQAYNCALSRFYHPSHISFVQFGTKDVSAGSDPDLHEFNNAYEIIRKAILQTEDRALTDVVNWSAKVLDYNVQGGKKNRGVTVLKSFKVLSEEKPLADKILDACILGWCVEMLQGFFVVCDDIMDNSAMRRGKPCWYKMPGVGLIAINDGLLLECTIYKILEMYFKNCKTYNDILHEFLQVTRKTVYGQSLDMLNVPPNTRPRFENFNLEKYSAVVEYKTSHYTFCLPVHLAMHLVGNFSEKEFELSRDICLKLGLLFQIQDDYIDAFGDSAITGKIGTDIKDGKCTWFSASLLECAPDFMKETMMENYGVDSTYSVTQVIGMYEELCLEEKFFESEQALTKEITLMIESLPRDSSRALFHSLLKKLYQRRK